MTVAGTTVRISVERMGGTDPMQFAEELTTKGVTERRFTLDRPQEPVPGVLWTPEGADTPRPLVALGHGGTQHKAVPNIVALARRLVRHHGYAAVAIDLPFHGDRVPESERGLSREERRELLRRRNFGREQAAAVTELAVADWVATLDAVQALDCVGAGAVGYWGVSMGTHFGVPLLAAEPRIGVAVLGLFGWSERAGRGFDDLARSVTVPLLFLVQWDDEVVPRDLAFGLFDLFGSTDKTLHANPGGHVEIPRAERDAAEAHFALHLGAARPAETAA